ncbi:MAG TPA: tetratricopeptide repeat protein [Usitatibacter sp.]|jgi:CRISPR-associated protein Csy1|nr:tetratricopeptide repeat protein [Usitatibacter sp.]
MSSPPDPLAQVRQLVAAGRRAEARALLQPLAAAAPAGRAALHLAELEILEGDAARALARLAPFEPQGDADAAFLVARAHEMLGNLPAARDALLAARARQPQPSAPLELQLGIVLQKLGDLEGAIAAMRTAVALRPDVAASHRNLAAVLVAAGRVPEARDALRQALDAHAQDATLWLRLAAVSTQLGDAVAALQALERAVMSMPATAGAWRDIGHAYAEYWRYEDAERALNLAAALDPGQSETESLRAVVRQELGDTQGALEALRSALARAPADLPSAVNERLMLPQVYEDPADVLRWRERYTNGMADLERNLPAWLPRPGDVFRLNRNNFLLAYQGEDDRDLQRRYSAFLAQLVGRARPQWRERRPIRFDGAHRLRVGYVGNIFRDCTAGKYFERWVTGLDPARFERIVYHSAPVSDELTRRIAASADGFVALRGTADECAPRILADELDVLVLPEVGMNALTYELATMRLAPVQAAGWGHPVTTGSDTIDFYFTCDAMEPADAASHYVERLVRLPGIGVDYSMPAAQPPIDRAQLGLPTDRRLYACAQSLFKVHPEMDDVLADLLARDAQAVLVFFQAGSRRVTEQLGARLQRALARRGVPPRGQLKFLPRMGGGDFRRVLAAVDVVLDTFRWSGGNTSIDAFAAGAPVVTLPGRFMRGRQTAGMLELMQVKELIVRDAGEYVRHAIEVASDPALNAGLRQAIAERRGVLFDRPEPLAAFAQALLAMGSGELTHGG